MTAIKMNRLNVVLSMGLAIATLGAMAPAAKAGDFSLNFDYSADGGSLRRNADGTLDTTQWSDWGLTSITGKNNRTQNAAKFNAYNTEKNGQDNDLRTGSTWGTEKQGSVLLIQEEDNKNNNYFANNNKYRSDDEAWGGQVNFNFEDEIKLSSFTMLDIDDDGDDRHNYKKSILVQGYDATGESVLNVNVADLIDAMVLSYGSDASKAYNQSVTIDGVTMTQKSNVRGDNSMFEFTFTDTYLSDIDFIYPGSGAIAGLEWSTPDVSGPRAVPEPTGVASLLLMGLGAGKLRRLRKRNQEQ